MNIDYFPSDVDFSSLKSESLADYLQKLSSTFFVQDMFFYADKLALFLQTIEEKGRKEY